MPRKRQHGGRRQPANPVATSGPGNLSQRTDGGPGSETQPLRVPTGLRFGQRQALLQQQQAAPLPVAGGAGVGGATAPAVPVAPPLQDVFRPTERPLEDPSTGITQPATPLEFDPDIHLRAILAAGYDHPDIMALIALRANDA